MGSEKKPAPTPPPPGGTPAPGPQPGSGGRQAPDGSTTQRPPQRPR